MPSSGRARAQIGIAHCKIAFANYGKSTAFYATDTVFEIGPDAMSKVAAHEIPVPLRKLKFDGTLPPGKEDFNHAYTRIITKPEYDVALKLPGWAVIAGTFVYYDLAGNLYTTDFCSVVMGSGAIGNCIYKHKTKKAN